MLSNTNITELLKNFPNVELCYETNIHNKVCGVDIIFAIPEGKKSFIWFTKYNKENICLLLEIGNLKQIINFSVCKTTFEDTLSYGTIFYGTFFKINNNSYFTIEDVLYYKGESLQKITFLNKLNILKNMFKQKLIQKDNNSIIFGLPLFVIGDYFNKLLDNIQKLPYKISKIHFRYLYKKQQTIFSIHYFKPGLKYQNTNIRPNHKNIKNNAIFKITPDIQNDIYYLHTYNYKTNKNESYDIAYIPDYTTSVLMNSLFRNIKENNNLDALEESDDEEEFENNKLDKFVYLDKSFNMNCVYNSKFKKWVPVSIALNNANIISSESLEML
jgi:hypothetical protein